MIIRQSGLIAYHADLKLVTYRVSMGSPENIPVKNLAARLPGNSRRRPLLLNPPL
jgi:hypothetical protein